MIVSCPECNGKLSTEAPGCPHCGYVPKASSNGAVREEPKREPSKEEVLFSEGNVQVTTHRFTVGGESFVIAQLSSVSTNTEVKEGAAGLALGAIAVIAGIIAACSGQDYIALGIGLGTLGMIVGGILYSQGGTYYHLSVTVTSAERQVLVTKDGALVQKITEALNKAISLK